jgi:hypothetical protein
MRNYLDIFDALKASRSGYFLEHHGLVVKTGEGLGAAILKLLKPAWTTDGPGNILNSNGVFFGVWVDAACAANGVARYNLHAKKLRVLKGQGFAAREFARSFRAEARTELAAWPALTYPKGPITLFEGQVPLGAGLAGDVSALMDRFAGLTPMIDRMLDGNPR